MPSSAHAQQHLTTVTLMPQTVHLYSDLNLASIQLCLCWHGVIMVSVFNRACSAMQPAVQCRQHFQELHLRSHPPTHATTCPTIRLLFRPCIHLFMCCSAGGSGRSQLKKTREPAWPCPSLPTSPCAKPSTSGLSGHRSARNIAPSSTWQCRQRPIPLLCAQLQMLLKSRFP